mmetsp:Transcript_7570/g.10873  ORF Transcript_7570/g.10873 Transcript_7570/m.10873 type:complete len:664 (-) Transcript_7570:74-2065(-)|eukprot:CAMPEP_0194106176 /NCGR_PEP_ID=MMETSP0150-20130528/6258_1 /TAXON_ID=122233 /ORGANISM="Chaetoceros debilis, Strain MM31A-1" /LENGTH=663 /DNA_ID=CAMNT_0038794255 /DNA_START=85 /DNA_END=2072 /DNA_ORIENTATION=-
MSGRDPFPMQSDEARRLAASVDKPDSENNWNRMDTTVDINNDGSNNDGSGADIVSGVGGELDQQASLMASKIALGTGASKDGSIYDDMDKKSKAEIYMETDDDYLDHDMTDRHNPTFSKIKNTALTIHRYLFGDKLPPTETIRTMVLSSTLFFMIGGYWLLRSLKDPIITHLCGVSAIPKAKMLSVFVVLFVVSVYNRLLDNPNIPKHKLFYIFGMFYFCLFSVIAMLLTHPTIGLANETADYGRVLGWISYCSIESFGSVMVSLFWSFANSNYSLESKKALYGLLVATAQVGSILGPTAVSTYAETLGVASVYGMGALCMLLLQSTMYMYVNIYGTDETRSLEKAEKSKSGETKLNGKEQPKKKGAGVLEGVHLFVKHNYVKGIFAISCLFMIEVTIVDYTMKVLARDHFAGLYPCMQGNSCWNDDESKIGMSADATAAFTTFMGLFGIATNTLSLMLSFFGTSAIIRYLGLRITLLLFPTLCLIVIIVVRFNPTLYVVFAAMMILKATSYALNNPTKEMLYQPTSSAVRYKAKSWIDIFGARGSKAMGSLVTNAFSDSAANLVQNGSLVGMCVASFLIWNARFMGRKFDTYIESGYVVGGEDEDGGGNEGENIQMACAQNEVEDTSCGIYDDLEIRENVSDHSQEIEEEKGHPGGAKVEMV